MFSAQEVHNLVALIGTARPAQYSEAHAMYPTVDKLIKLESVLKNGGKLMVLTDLEADAIAEARKPKGEPATIVAYADRQSPDVVS
jgi:hypothetical protein